MNIFSNIETTAVETDFMKDVELLVDTVKKHFIGRTGLKMEINKEQSRVNHNSGRAAIYATIYLDAVAPKGLILGTTLASIYVWKPEAGDNNFKFEASFFGDNTGMFMSKEWSKESERLKKDIIVDLRGQGFEYGGPSMSLPGDWKKEVYELRKNKK